MLFCLLFSVSFHLYRATRPICVVLVYESEVISDNCADLVGQELYGACRGVVGWLGGWVVLGINLSIKVVRLALPIFRRKLASLFQLFVLFPLVQLGRGCRLGPVSA